MKKLFNYSLLMLLFSFIAFACSKEDGDMGPSASLTSNTSLDYEYPVGDFNLTCLKQSGSKWSFHIKAGARHGLSNLQLELLACPGPGTTVELDEGSIINANIVINGITYPLVPIYNSDGSCISIKGSEFISFVKFEFEKVVINGTTYELDELVKKYGGELYFSLTDGTLEEGVTLYGANVIIKTGGKDNKCYRGKILNCNGCVKDCPPVDCSFSQGRFFNPGNGGKWPAEFNGIVTVGNTDLAQGDKTLPATNSADRAYFQAATIILSSTNLDALDESTREAFDYIVAYFTVINGVRGNNGARLQEMAGKIGNWIDANHC